MAAPLNPCAADPQYRVLLNRLFPEENRGRDPALRVFELILSNDTKALQDWVSDPKKVAERVNEVATQMFLHPLHVCAMTGNMECARILIDTKICMLDPQDVSRSTPLHHAAVRGNQAMILYFLKSGAQRLPDQYGGDYVSILRQMQKPNPDKQIIHIKNESGVIVRADGNTFREITGATLLEKDCRCTPQEWLKLWEGDAKEPQLLPPSLLRRYEEFLNKPTQLYLEKHATTGFNVCAGQNIEPGMVIGEYLGEVSQGGGLFMGIDSASALEKVLGATEYVYGDIDATRSRGVIAMCNDSFPNAVTSNLYNVKGIPERFVLVAIAPIKKGERIVFHYGLGHGIRFANRVELRREEFLGYFIKECASGFTNFVNKAVDANDSAIMNGHLPDAGENMPLQALLYIFTTPTAMLHLLCQGIISVKELESLFSPQNKNVLTAIKMWANTPNFRQNWARLEDFYQVVFLFFDQLQKLSIKQRQEKIKLLQLKIDSSDLRTLIVAMGGVSEAWTDRFNKSELERLKALQNLADNKEE